MKRNILICLSLLLTTSLFAADNKLKEEVTNAAKKLGEKGNYSWKTTVTVPEGSQFRPGPTDGKTEKDGYTHVTMSFGDNSSQMVLKGDKGAVTNQDGDWQSVSELENSEGPGRFMAMMVRNFRAPAAQAAELAAGVKEFKKDGEAYTGELTEDAAKSFLRFRRGSDASVSNAKGSTKFWLKDGVISKFEYKVSGTISFNGNDRDIDRTTTVEIKEVDSTKVTVPEEAKKKIS